MDIGQELACWLESDKPDNGVTRGRGLHKAGPKQNQEVVAGEGWEGPPGGKSQPSTQSKSSDLIYQLSSSTEESDRIQKAIPQSNSFTTFFTNSGSYPFCNK